MLHDAFESLAFTILASRAWLTNGIESLICPVLFCLLWLLIYFVKISLNEITQAVKNNSDSRGDTEVG